MITSSPNFQFAGVGTSSLESPAGGWNRVLAPFLSSGRNPDATLSCYLQARSKRSRFMTLFHAAMKSRTNFSFESAHA